MNRFHFTRRARNRGFVRNFACYSMAMLDRNQEQVQQADRGGKIIMPSGALEDLTRNPVQTPMMFCVENHENRRATHCGVLEFVAEEGTVLMPYWMMENLLVKEGDIITVRLVELPLGTFVKIQPDSKDFLDISNPKAVLEQHLRNLSALTVGDKILIHYLNKQYPLGIIDLKPDNAVSIIETDLEVDFAPPLDYVEETSRSAPSGNTDPRIGSHQGKSESLAKQEESKEERGFVSFGGAGRRITDSVPTYRPTPSSSASTPARRMDNTNEQQNQTPDTDGFSAFRGKSRRLE